MTWKNFDPNEVNVGGNFWAPKEDEAGESRKGLYMGVDEIEGSYGVSHFIGLSVGPGRELAVRINGSLKKALVTAAAKPGDEIVVKFLGFTGRARAWEIKKTGKRGKVVRSNDIPF